MSHQAAAAAAVTYLDHPGRYRMEDPQVIQILLNMGLDIPAQGFSKPLKPITGRRVCLIPDTHMEAETRFIHAPTEEEQAFRTEMAVMAPGLGAAARQLITTRPTLIHIQEETGQVERW